MMNDLISRSALIDSAFECEPLRKGNDEWAIWHNLYTRIKYAPAADVAQVVRCKDCKHNGTWQCHMEYDEYRPEADIHHEMHGDDDFCSYGVKEDGDSND